MRYNCIIIAFHDRSVVGSKTKWHIASGRAIHYLQEALVSRHLEKGVLSLHSDQRRQYNIEGFS
jgi:hypothetical protein